MNSIILEINIRWLLCQDPDLIPQKSTLLSFVRNEKTVGLMFKESSAFTIQRLKTAEESRPRLWENFRPVKLIWRNWLLWNRAEEKVHFKRLRLPHLPKKWLIPEIPDGSFTHWILSFASFFLLRCKAKLPARKLQSSGINADPCWARPSPTFLMRKYLTIPSGAPR